MKKIIFIALIALLGLFYFFSGLSDEKLKPINNSVLEGEGINLSDITYYMNIGDTTMVDTNLNPAFTYYINDAFVSKSNNGAVVVGANPISNLLKPSIINIDLIIDDSLNGKVFIDTSIRIKQINSVLKVLNSGFQIKFDTIIFSQLPSSTNGKVNTNSLIREIPKGNDSKYTVCLFNDSEFFNTANAIAMTAKDENNKEKIFILGNGYLLESGYLFAHELFHALGLTHNNKLYSTCPDSEVSLSNVMNESNIGCSRRLSARQIILMNSKTYVPSLKTEKLFPNGSSCTCNFTGLNSEVEQYLNSFDRNIDDTPLVGDDEVLFEKIASLRDTILPKELKDQIKENYEREYLELVNIGYVDTNYVKERLEIHERLRMYNLCRWLKENAELKGDSLPDNFWEMSSDTLVNVFYKYAENSINEFCAFKCKEDNQNCNSKIFNCDNCSNGNGDFRREAKPSKRMIESMISFENIFAPESDKKIDDSILDKKPNSGENDQEIQGNVKPKRKKLPQVKKPIQGKQK